MEYLLILLAALARVVPHPSNVTPVAAMALFGGAFLSRRFALLYPLAVMLISDLILNLFVYDIPIFIPESFLVYASFLITGGLGIWCRNRRTLGVLVGVSFASSVQFFLLTNFGTWLFSGLYPQTGAGLVQCYTFALPFFQQSVLGDLFWLSCLLGAHRIASRWLPARIRASF